MQPIGENQGEYGYSPQKHIHMFQTPPSIPTRSNVDSHALVHFPPPNKIPMDQTHLRTNTYFHPTPVPFSGHSNVPNQTPFGFSSQSTKQHHREPIRMSPDTNLLNSNARHQAGQTNAKTTRSSVQSSPQPNFDDIISSYHHRSTPQAELITSQQPDRFNEPLVPYSSDFNSHTLKTPRTILLNMISGNVSGDPKWNSSPSAHVDQPTSPCNFQMNRQTSFTVSSHSKREQTVFFSSNQVTNSTNAQSTHKHINQPHVNQNIPLQIRSNFAPNVPNNQQFDETLSMNRRVRLPSVHSLVQTAPTSSGSENRFMVNIQSGRSTRNDYIVSWS
ncbi:uncharacterized protein MELLADRAFT_62052 [Melampsora larici-populina 98AG31]|uniref:Uncharacterized protein n=1 Tax=Melampsora larici-populina (strain 98AG31 / pathotype 3-4-7) TaxID=747676 RepID=F4RH21_MELLP|nr:uncharacterized protein MELLADRAFT_62052 [Melampsora larici-populina 98AG31]EGG08308.1 hypothetical protein MELLADRAFT_62052 [Melampsora larici-populina 98AG31]